MSENNDMEPQKSCALFIPRKRRFCRLIAAKGTDYCVHHIPKQDREKIDRIPCPYNDDHNITTSGLKRHLKVCPNRPEATNNAPRVNSVIDATRSKTIDLLPPIYAIPDEVFRFIEKLKRLENVLSFTNELSDDPVHEEFIPVINVALHNTRHWSVNGFPGWSFIQETKNAVPSKAINEPISTKPHEKNDQDVSVPDSRGSKRHIYQNGCLLNVLRAAQLLSRRFVYVEFGAGRGGLSHWLNLCLACEESENQSSIMKEVSWIQKPVDTNFILVELKSTRYKFDTRHRDAGNFIRLRMDIAELRLDTVPAIVTSKKPIVAVAKHLCGDATDLSLRCLKNAIETTKSGDSTPLKIGGLMFAVCCHHQCSWEESVGRPWLERDAGLTAREFAIATRLSSWATCGFKRAPRSHDNEEQEKSQPQNESEQELRESPFSCLNPDERISIGRACKRLIDWGRLCFIRHELGFPRASMLTYTSLDVTAENVVLVAGTYDSSN